MKVTGLNCIKVESPSVKLPVMFFKRWSEKTAQTPVVLSAAPLTESGSSGVVVPMPTLPAIRVPVALPSVPLPTAKTPLA